MNNKVNRTGILLMACLIIFSCKKDEEELPAPAPSPKVETVVWEKIHTMSTNGELCHYKMDNNTAWILQSSGTTAQLLSTTDAGKSWTQKDVGISPPAADNVYFISKTEGYISLRHNETHYTTDGGNSWKEISEREGALHVNNNVLSLINNAGKKGSVYQYNPKTDSTTLTNDSLGESAVFPKPTFEFGNKIIIPHYNCLVRSDDGGNTWKIQESPFSAIRFFTMKNAQSWYVAPEAGGLYESLDDGNTWNKIFDQRLNSNNFDFHKDTLFASLDGEAHWSLDGKSYTKLNEETVMQAHFFSIGDNLIRYNKDGIYLKKVVLK